MNIGIIGIGKHGARYAEHIVKDVPGLQLTAVARRSEEGREQARRWRCRWFADWGDLVRSPEVDAVICAVPPTVNAAIADLCGRLGKPMLVEKPLAGNAESAAQLVRHLDDCGVALTVGQTLRYNPVIRKLRDELSELGTLHTCYANQRLEPGSQAWLEDPAVAGAGVALHIAVHVFDALFFITGLKIVRVAACCKTVRTSLLEDVVLIRVEMENDVSGLIDVSKVGLGRSGRYEFICSSGHLYGDQIRGYVNRVSEAGETTIGRYDPVPTIMPLLQDWLRFLSGTGPNPVPGKDGLYAVRVGEACRESCRTGSWAEVPAE